MLLLKSLQDKTAVESGEIFMVFFEGLEVKHALFFFHLF